MHVPFVDLKRQYHNHREELDRAVLAVMESAQFILGNDVNVFEEGFARFCGTRDAVGVASGTAALELALRAFNVGPGDEVIVPGNTFIASALAVSAVGATPVLADVRDADGLVELCEIQKVVTSRTKVIMPVHLFGKLVDIVPICAFAKERNIFVLEDACQAHGAKLQGVRAGSFGDAAAFSFYPGKNLGCFGDGGAVTTNDVALADRIRVLRDFGQTAKYHHSVKSANHRLDTIQAAVLNVKMNYIDEWNARRRVAAARYNELFKGTHVRPLAAPLGEDHVVHLYVVDVPNRPLVMKYLQKSDIQFGIHYPVPIHKQAAYRELMRFDATVPHTNRLADRIISLPMFPEITGAEVEHVAAVVRAAVDSAELERR